MMKIIGVTGGTGGGKTTVTNILKSFGARIVDADVIARQVVASGCPALSEIAARWDVMENGVLNRKALAEIVFNDEAELHKLNSIVHKYVIDEIKSQLANCTDEIFVIDAIALFESGLSDMCDITVAVIADRNVRCKRIMARDNLTEEEAWMRINAQKNDEFYINNADVAICNNEDISYEEIKETIKRELM
ncbi:MAG: dephospho-CoA kinase [Clostridia bacterium]|nr:dephospho-CoA kinase [Clostridia bacterium]